MSQNGLFLVFEGGDGSGKSSQRDILVERLKARGLDVVPTREPGGTPFAEQIRDLLLRGAMDKMHPKTGLGLFAAARAEHLEALVYPHLAAGRIVISDRFVDSTFAYQGAGEGCSMETIAALHRELCDDAQANLTILLDGPVRTLLERALGRIADTGSLEDRFESADIAFHERKAQCYRDRAAAAPERYLVVDALQSIEAIADQIEAGVLRLIENRRIAAA
jgi:dTMP kinase